MSAQEIEPEMKKLAFEQNHASFRSLNQQMWQIPLISMTLTGGLWFGVSHVPENAEFQAALLALAAVGNVALIIILQRLRYVMQAHLNWLEATYKDGFVSAVGDRWHNKPFVVKFAFQFVLLTAAVLSLVLLVQTFDIRFCIQLR